MTFKEFIQGVGYLPANAFTGLVKLVLGSTEKVEHVNEQSGKVEFVEDKVNPGLLGLAVDGIKFVGRSIADFLSEHKKAIATAAWLSLVTAGAVALTLFLWPAALTAVASFSIYGVSIAGIAGANALAQIGLASVLAAAAVSAVTYVGAGFGNFVKWLADCCKGLKSKAPEGNPAFEDDDEEKEEEQKDLKTTEDRGVTHDHTSSSEVEFDFDAEQTQGNLYARKDLRSKGSQERDTATIHHFDVDHHASPFQTTVVERRRSAEEETVVLDKSVKLGSSN
ncbi:hypothetical protein DGG96_05460 [Legionella qingyii]|uniref:Transmembrane protein n=1 Tax=Legionella qingyii TaxID=2184757 RepID=A0A317U7R2_9GAMM|nr:hypothetical protein [Legionella qingyii]PWY56572.1 hypothetical protein DGG96_05460 [Legionella qingyii]RUR23386.1 hypothetical protein ELY20_07190 [Legionella qingyii]RUR26168.1 hypothetical protein ELY16_08485 [Legionella qingyii]